jgi:hypothetical protein
MTLSENSQISIHSTFKFEKTSIDDMFRSAAMVAKMWAPTCCRLSSNPASPLGPSKLRHSLRRNEWRRVGFAVRTEAGEQQD